MSLSSDAHDYATIDNVQNVTSTPLADHTSRERQGWIPQALRLSRDADDFSPLIFLEKDAVYKIPMGDAVSDQT